MADTQTKLTEEQLMQHRSVMSAAGHNLNLVIDQFSSLNSPKFDSVLECLDSAKDELAKVKL